MTSTPGDLEFGVAVHYEYRQDLVVAAPRGELDILSAGDFARALDAATEGRNTLLVDLSDLEFCDGTGLGVMADVARRLADRGGGLSVRSPSAMVSQLLDISGLDALITVVNEPRRGSRAGGTEAQQVADALADGLVQLAEDGRVDATMGMVATLAERLSAAVDAASVTMRRRGSLMTVATTHPVADAFDQAQYESGSGPCVEAATGGLAVHGHPGNETSEWPALREPARQAGIHAVLSTPFLDGPHLFGALNLYALGRDFSDADGEIASALVGEAAKVLVVEPLDRHDLSERVSQGFADRDRIAWAQGIIMERHNLSARRAYARLLHDSTANATFLHDTAAQVIDEATREDRAPPEADER